MNRDYKDKNGNTQLHFAVADNNTEAVQKIILELKANYQMYVINMSNNNLATPLHWAA